MADLIVSSIQFTAIDGEKESTIEKALHLIDLAGKRGSKIVVLPEVWTGLAYSEKEMYKDIAEPIPGPVTEKLAEYAKKYQMYIAGSFYEKDDQGRFFNSCPLIGPSGDIIGVYRKTHLFDAPNRDDIKGVRESDKVTAGDLLPTFETEYGTVGVSVCSDLRFPEIYRVLTLKGAKIIICASAFLSPRLDHWEFFCRARAAENQVWLIASGQYGTEPKSGYSFVGRSMIVDPWGTIVATASDQEACTTTTIDLDFVNKVRERYPLLEQRRPELYASIARVD